MMLCAKTAPLLRLLVILFLSAISALAAATAARADELTLEIDAAASSVDFDFGATLHEVSGTLRLQGGTIHLDTATGVASGEITAVATSAQTGIERRDHKMHEKILESATFPTIVFKVERIDGPVNRTGHSDLQLHGTLTLHGTSLPASILATASATGDRVQATGHFTVPYLKFGMPDPSVFLLRVAKEVHVTLHIVGHLLPAATSAIPPTPAPSGAAGAPIRPGQGRPGRR
jgi:polyisoprenoid-binding protein YceI